MGILKRKCTWMSHRALLPHKPELFANCKMHFIVLKQSPRAWIRRFCSAMKLCGFKQSNSDHTLFLKHRGKLVTVLIIYVDDIIITGNFEKEISNLQEHLATKFEMKNLGGLKYFLGIEVARSSQGIFLLQRKYVLNLLPKTCMLNYKPAYTPIVQNHRLGEHPNHRPTNRIIAACRQVNLHISHTTRYCLCRELSKLIHA